MANLHNVKRILLLRMENGWYLRDEDSNLRSDPKWVFESTESLAEQLVDILGKSGWRVSVPQKEMPSGGKGGKFLPKNGVDGTPQLQQESTRSQT